MLSCDCSCPFARAWAWVILPTILDPLGKTTLPSDFTSWEVFATTSSPTLFLRTSTGLVNSPSTVLPAGTSFAGEADAFLLETFAACDAAAEVLDPAGAPDLSAETEVACDAGPLDCMSADV